MDTSWQVASNESPQETEHIPQHSVKEPAFQALGFSLTKRTARWILLGIIFFSLYTGGSYYVLFLRGEKKPETQVPVIPTSIPRASATPYPTPTRVPTVQPTDHSTTSWNTYTNETYGISVQFPTGMIINFNRTETGIDPYLILISYPNASQSGELKIDIQDSRYLGQSEVESLSIMEMELETFAQKKWELNSAYTDLTIPVRNVGPLTAITYAGKPAYTFVVVGSYKDDRTYAKLSTEHTYIITENRDKKIIISYPTEDALLKQILNTITLQ